MASIHTIPHHIPNAEHGSNVDLRLGLLIALGIALFPALLMILEQDINRRRRLAGRASHTGAATKANAAEEGLHLALAPPSPAPRASAVPGEPAVARAAAEVGHLDGLAAALVPEVVVTSEAGKLAPELPQRGEDKEEDKDDAEGDQALARVVGEVVSAGIKPAVERSDVGCEGSCVLAEGKCLLAGRRG